MTGTVRFVLGGRVVEVADPAPATTVLQWLRSTGRTGTKEGCAEGDCGACTVVLGELDAGDQLKLRAVNACILFLPMIHGKLLLTIEDLSGDSDTVGGATPHPVQTAMVHHHASQCGFCTPGFAMALFALRHDQPPTGTPAGDLASLHDGLAGNLCRCTGYRPIIAAGIEALADPAAGTVPGDMPAMIALLQGLRNSAGPMAPQSVEALETALMTQPGATLVAGATDVGLWVTKQGRDIAPMILLSAVPELQVITEDDRTVEVGAAVTYAQLLPVLDRRLPELAALVRRMGAAQVRNSGTLVGNIANGSPIGDSMPALLALGATLTLNRGGMRRTVPLDSFYLGYRKKDLLPGEFVEKVRIPIPETTQRFATWKVSKRRDQDISAVCAAFLLDLDEAGRVRNFRAGFGGVAAIPTRAPQLEAALIGTLWSEDTVEAALEALDRDISPIGDMRASGAYRQLVARNLLRRFFHWQADRGTVDLEAAHG